MPVMAPIAAIWRHRILVKCGQERLVVVDPAALDCDGVAFINAMLADGMARKVVVGNKSLLAIGTWVASFYDLRSKPMLVPPDNLEKYPPWASDALTAVVDHLASLRKRGRISPQATNRLLARLASYPPEIVGQAADWYLHSHSGRGGERAFMSAVVQHARRWRNARERSSLDIDTAVAVAIKERYGRDKDWGDIPASVLRRIKALVEKTEVRNG